MTDAAHTRVQRAGALVLALLGIVPLANLLSDGREIVWWRGAVLVWIAYGLVLIALLWVVADRWGGALDRLAEGAVAAVMRVPSRWFVAALSCLTTVLAGFVAIYCYGGRPFTGDEMATNWHARMLLAGRLSIPRPAHSEFFNTFGVMDSGPRWFSQFPIGAPALHALGFAIGDPWMVNALLLGLTTWQLYRFVRLAFDEPTARAAALLFTLCPFLLVLGATQMSHTPALFLTVAAFAELVAWDDARDERARLVHAAGLGLAVAGITLVRPYDAALVAAPIGIFQIARSYRSWERIRSIAVQCVAGLIPVAILLWANARTTGSPLLFAYEAAYGPAHGVGFHLDPTGVMHTPRRGVQWVSGYLLRFNRFLFEWPVPAMLVVCATYATLRRASRWDTLLLGLVASYLLGYAAFWGTGFHDGPRFFFPLVPVMVLAAARFPAEVSSRLRGTPRRVTRALVPACVLCAWLLPVGFTSVPTRLTSLHQQRGKLKKDLGAVVRRAGITNALVFVPESWHERLAARLRALGVPMYDTEHLVSTLDACVLQTELDAIDAAPPRADTVAMRQQILARAAAAGARQLPGYLPETQLARAAGGLDTPRCRAESAADAQPVIPHAMFLREQQVDAQGHLAGPVIFARDFGARDTLLRAEYSRRRWYRYRPSDYANEPGRFEAMDGQ